MHVDDGRHVWLRRLRQIRLRRLRETQLLHVVISNLVTPVTPPTPTLTLTERSAANPNLVLERDLLTLTRALSSKP